MKFGIVCDSAADLSRQELDALGVTEVPIRVCLEDGSLPPLPEFYETLAQRRAPAVATVPPAVEQYAAAFDAILSRGLEVLCICMSQKFSGSCRAALQAGRGREDRVHVLDSQQASALEGILVREAARLRDLDYSASRVLSLLEAICPTGHMLFTTRDLQYLIRSGILVGSRYADQAVQAIRPILHYHRGELTVESVCRGQRRSLHRLVNAAMECIRELGPEVENYIFCTGRGEDFPDYEEFVTGLRRRLEESGLQPAGWVDVRIGAVIGAHTGPGPVGLGLIRRCDP